MVVRLQTLHPNERVILLFVEVRLGAEIGMATQEALVIGGSRKLQWAAESSRKQQCAADSSRKQQWAAESSRKQQCAAEGSRKLRTFYRSPCMGGRTRHIRTR